MEGHGLLKVCSSASCMLFTWYYPCVLNSLLPMPRAIPSSVYIYSIELLFVLIGYYGRYAWLFCTTAALLSLH